MVTSEEKRAFMEEWLATLGQAGQTPELARQIHELLMKDTIDGKLYKYRSFDKKGYSIKSLRTSTLHCSNPIQFIPPQTIARIARIAQPGIAVQTAFHTKNATSKTLIATQISRPIDLCLSSPCIKAV